MKTGVEGRKEKAIQSLTMIMRAGMKNTSYLELRDHLNVFINMFSVTYNWTNYFNSFIFYF